MVSDILEFFIGMGDLIFGKDKEKVEKETEEKFYLSEVKPKKFLYRPQNLEEFISQDKRVAKNRLGLWGGVPWEAFWFACCRRIQELKLG